VAEVPAGGFSVIGSSAVWATGPWGCAAATARPRREGLLDPERPVGFVDEAGLAPVFFFSAQASGAISDRMVAAARKSRRFK
jgi:hypothetical protein